MRSCRDPRGRRSCQRLVSLVQVSGREDGLSDLIANLKDAVLFDRSDLWVGTQIVQVIVGEFSGVAVDEIVLVGDIACGSRNAGLDGAKMGSKRHVVLEGDDIPARDGFFSLRDGEKGGHRERVP